MVSFELVKYSSVYKPFIVTQVLNIICTDHQGLSHCGGVQSQPINPSKSTQYNLIQ